MIRMFIAAAAVTLIAGVSQAQVYNTTYVNPWTGGLVQASGAQNPWTGQFTTQKVYTNPRTGVQAVGQTVYNPRNGVRYDGIRTFSPVTGFQYQNQVTPTFNRLQSNRFGSPFFNPWLGR
ncbi:MAG: hypothetical protein ACRCZF_24505 [Gemmataceae bacterium]